VENSRTQTRANSGKFSEQKQKRNESGVGGWAAGQAVKPLPGREKQPNPNWPEQWKILRAETKEE
jgi:hypothetical protein